MITTNLVVNNYCHDCPYFEAETCTTRRYVGLKATLLDTQVVVSCKYKDHCRNIYKYMKKENKNE